MADLRIQAELAQIRAEQRRLAQLEAQLSALLDGHGGDQAAPMPRPGWPIRRLARADLVA